MKVQPTELADVLDVEFRVFADVRGFFLETYHAAAFASVGLPTHWVQDNRSHSALGVVRGLHFQCLAPQGKLVWCTRGKIWDIAVDIRVGSPTYGAWVSRTLTDTPGQALFVPPGFAHGFCALTDGAELAYKVTALYDPSDEAGIRWDDPALQIPWPVTAPLLSAKDVQLPTLHEARALGLLPHYAP